MSRYRQVREILAREIASGIFPVGGRFPTETELRARFGVSRHTVREALRQLQDEGVLYRHRGLGTVVCGMPQPVYSQTFTNLSELQSYAAEATLDVESKNVLTVRAALADRLGCPVGRRWLHVSGTRTLLGHLKPLCWTDMFFAEPYIQFRDELNGGAEPQYQVLQRLTGVTVSDVEQQITALEITADIAERLDCEPGSPGMMVRRRYFDNSIEPFEISVGLYPADRYAYTSRTSKRIVNASARN